MVPKRKNFMLSKISRIGPFSGLVKRLGVDRLCDSVLSRWCPVRTASYGAKYYLDSISTAVAASEVFHSTSYSKPLQEVKPDRIVDVGANVGLFTLLASKQCSSGVLRALLVEPDLRNCNKLERNLALNGLNLDTVKLIRGAVSEQTSGSVDLFVNRSHIASSLSGRFNPGAGTKVSMGTQITPLVDVYALWQQTFGSERIELLKVDVEGEEMGFLRGHRPLLDNCENIIIEWHKWMVTFSDLDDTIRAEGFHRREILEQDRHAGVAWYTKSHSY
jgi:FkbM family methyltransferase